MTEIIDGLIGAVGLSLLHQGTHGGLAHGFNGGQTNTDAGFWAAILVNSEELVGPVDIGQQHGNSQPETLVDRAYDFFGMVQPGIQHRRHIFQGIVRLEISRPIGDKSVANAVGFVERVAGEGLYEVEYRGCQTLVKPFCGSPSYKLFSFLGHQRRDLLAHGLAHDVGFTQRVSSELLKNQQHLVLINDDAVGLVQQFFHAGVWIGDRFAPEFRVDEIVYVFHGARPVQGDHGRDIH